MHNTYTRIKISDTQNAVGCSVVHLTSMGNPHDEDDHNIVLDLRNQAIVVHAITPLTAAIRGQPLAVQARIAASFKVTTNPRDNHGIDVTVKFL